MGDLVLDLADVRAPKSEPAHSLMGRVAGIRRIIQFSGAKLQGARADAFGYLSEAFKDDRLLNVCCAALVTAATPPDSAGAAERAAEYKESSLATFAHFAPSLCQAAAADRPEETRKLALSAVKLFCQAHPEGARTSAKLLLPPLLAAFRDAALFRVKALAERAFYYLSEGGSAPVLSGFAQILSGDDSSFMRDYSKRIIAKMSPTEEEEEQW